MLLILSQKKRELTSQTPPVQTEQSKLVNHSLQLFSQKSN